ncbi:MAG: DASH family cryptochrome, partial [Opitutae bacterium]|nr:DASH family cryptochrome [Opitutae bacterium]
MKRGIIWFRNNLRLADNECIIRALDECDEVLCVYIMETETWNASAELSRISSIRAKFILESLDDLKSSIESVGGGIEFIQGQAVEEIPRLMESFGADICYAQKEDAWEETEVERLLSSQVNLVLTAGKGIWEDEDLPFALDDLPAVFSSFRRKVEKNMHIRSLLSSPKSMSCSWKSKTELPTLASLGFEECSTDERAVLDFKGGAKEAKKWMHQWIWERDCLKEYKETRNGLVGADYSSKLSPWLSTGCISVVEVYWEIKKYEKERVANDSTYWLFFELLWREFFRFVARRYGAQIFKRNGIKDSNEKMTLGDPKTFHRWKEGRTSNAFVNANMIELARTGWMSNRGRQNVASYLVHDLGQDWLAGARHFEEHLIDYDPCSNYGNWMYLGGVGNDPRPNRAFNLEKQ